jgi:hypothetical protein
MGDEEGTRAGLWSADGSAIHRRTLLTLTQLGNADEHGRSNAMTE